MNKETMSLDELQQTSEYKALTEKQQLFVATYVQTCIDGKPDPIHAVEIAYQCKNRNSARVMSYPMLYNIRIVAALDRYFQREPREAFLLVLDRAIANRRLGVAQLQALRLKAQVLGLRSGMPAEGRTVKNLLEDLHDDEREVKRKNRKHKQAAPAPDEVNHIADWVKGKK